jgi:hypothetical protein
LENEASCFIQNQCFNLCPPLLLPLLRVFRQLFCLCPVSLPSFSLPTNVFNSCHFHSFPQPCTHTRVSIQLCSFSSKFLERDSLLAPFNPLVHWSSTSVHKARGVVDVWFVHWFRGGCYIVY